MAILQIVIQPCGCGIAAGETTKQSYKAVVLTGTGVQLSGFSSPILGWQSSLRNLSGKAIPILILPT